MGQNGMPAQLGAPLAPFQGPAPVAAPPVAGGLSGALTPFMGAPSGGGGMPALGPPPAPAGAPAPPPAVAAPPPAVNWNVKSSDPNAYGGVQALQAPIGQPQQPQRQPGFGYGGPGGGGY